jgi:thymidylate synthase (FAD)
VANAAGSIERVRVPDLDAVLGHRWEVGAAGFVRVIDYMGSDSAIVQAARVSYGVGTKSIHEDAGLIRYLMRHRHTTPFEMCELKLHVKAPMDVWRQWIRHRTASVNEYSTRYSIAIDEASTTTADAWRFQSSRNRQGSAGYLPQDIGARLSRTERKLQRVARKVYEERLNVGVAREQARKDLPLSTYTEAYWKIDLHNLLHFLELRMDEHAQQEIRSYACLIGHEVVKRWCPVAWQAFLDYRFNGMNLTDRELQIVQALAAGNSDATIVSARQFGWLERPNGDLRQNREREEAERKFKRLGLKVPWHDV